MGLPYGVETQNLASLLLSCYSFNIVGFTSEELQGDVGARLGVGQGIVVLSQVKSAVGGNGVQLMVGQLLELALGGHAGAVELIVRIIHLVATKHGLQAALVKGFVMGNERQPLNQGLDLGPNEREYGSIVGVLMAQAVYALAPVAVIVGFGLDKGIEGVGDFTVTHDDDPHRAHAGALAVGRLKVNRCKVSHLLVECLLMSQEICTYFIWPNAHWLHLKPVPYLPRCLLKQNGQTR